MKSLPCKLLSTPEGSQRPKPTGNLEHSPLPFPFSLPSLSPTPSLCLSLRGMLARTQSEPTAIIFAKSELQLGVHPCTDAGNIWIETTVDYSAFNSSVFCFQKMKKKKRKFLGRVGLKSVASLFTNGDRRNQQFYKNISYLLKSKTSLPVALLST